MKAPLAPDASRNELPIFFPWMSLLKVWGGCSSKTDDAVRVSHLKRWERNWRQLSLHFFFTHFLYLFYGCVFFFLFFWHPPGQSVFPLRRDVRALAVVAVPPVRSPASGDPVPGFDSTESLSQAQVTLPHCSLTSTEACTVSIYTYIYIWPN